jgi:hypothetical protein
MPKVYDIQYYCLLDHKYKQLTAPNTAALVELIYLAPLGSWVEVATRKYAQVLTHGR